MSTETEIAVIGAGPAGMAAASTAAACGARVTVLDEQSGPGGQIYRSIESVCRQRPADLSFLGSSYASGQRLVEMFRARHIDRRFGATVWHVETRPRAGYRDLLFSQDGNANRLAARHVVIATGAYERPVPVPGWTLPGVMTVGAVQSMLKSSGIYPAGRLVLAGSGPLLLQLAVQLIRAHIPISAIVDTTPPGRVTRSWPFMPAALLATPRLLEGLAMNRAIARSGVRVYRGASHLAVTGDERANGLSFHLSGNRHHVDADVVALHEGIIPNLQLSRLLGVDHEWHQRQHAFRPVLGPWGETSLDGIHVAGDGAGIAGAEAAARSGAITGAALAVRLGLIGESERDLATSEQRLMRIADYSLRPFLDAWFPPPDWIASAADDTLICRCEEVTAGQLRRCLSEGGSGPNQVKAFLRCGMGPCQGRMCASSVTTVLAAALQRSPDDVGSFRVRPPIKPVSVGEVATLERK